MQGKVAVVLGASGEKNFGSAIARKLAADGCRVVVAARRLEPLEQLASQINGLAVACDITNEAQIENLFARAQEHFGRVDVAVNSCGTHAHAPIAELSRDLITPTLEISFIGALLFFKHAAAAMPDGGSVITVSSLTARLPGPGYAVYASTRAGIDYAIKVAAVEYGAQGVRFNAVAAGLIETDMTADIFKVPGLVDAFVSQIPAGRMGNISDMAEAASWLADPERSGFVNGSIIDLSGGQHMGRLPG
jgi:NAD(P)-dependent dehydrogenase (short-subunit alcohol dehydrogenase family)